MNDFLHHVLHLFYQCTYNSFFSQIENFAAVVGNYSYLSRSNYRKKNTRKKDYTSTLLFTNAMSSQIFTIIILAKSFISFKTLFIYCISIPDLCIGNKLFLYRCLKKLLIAQLKKLLITHFHNKGYGRVVFIVCSINLFFFKLISIKLSLKKQMDD